MSRFNRLLLFAIMATALTLPAAKASAGADVSINLRIGDPYRGPRLVFQDEPDVVLVPGTRVYYIRDYDYDIYRYGSYWYYNYGGSWYRARRYSGPFTYVGYRSVPRAVTYVPARYRKHWRDDGPRGNAYGHYKEHPRDHRKDRDHDRGRGRGRH